MLAECSPFMTPAEFRAALEARKASEHSLATGTVRGLVRRIKADLSPSGRREGGEACVDALCEAAAVAAQRADAALLVEAVEAMRHAESCPPFESELDLRCDGCWSSMLAAFLRVWTGEERT